MCLGPFQRTSILAGGSAFAVLATLAAPAHAQTTGDSAAAAAVVERFHVALATGDGAAAMSLLASDAVILEGGGVESREAYRSHHLPEDIGFARVVKILRSPTRMTVRGDVAWAASTSTSTGRYRGRIVNSVGAELVVLTRTPEGWRISAIHWSSRKRRS